MVSDANKTLSKYKPFFQRQIKYIREGGWPAVVQRFRILFRRLVKLPSTILGGLFALPIVLLVRLLRPLVVIRFGPLDTSRIGHLSACTELYLCGRDAGQNNAQTFDIFYPILPYCNPHLVKMWKRQLRISRFAYWPDWLNRKLPNSKKHIIPYAGARDIDGLLEQTPIHLSFTPEQERLGQEQLRRIGIPKDAPFVCFHARDSAYLEQMYPNRDWSYHNHRDSSIQNYIPAVEELAGRGYKAIRMGAIVKEALATTNPDIIDYATNGTRTDFMDIYLSAKCHFFLSSGTGIDQVPMIFRRPIAFVNFLSFEGLSSWGSNYLLIPKKLWLREERRFMRFREILESGVGRFTSDEPYEQFGIEVVENSPEEIRAVVIEMDERLKGTWQTTEEDEALQRRFWSLFKASKLHNVIRTRIGSEFLRQNRALLD